MRIIFTYHLFESQRKVIECGAYRGANRQPQAVKHQKIVAIFHFKSEQHIFALRSNAWNNLTVVIEETVKVEFEIMTQWGESVTHILFVKHIEPVCGNHPCEINVVIIITIRSIYRNSIINSYSGIKIYFIGEFTLFPILMIGNLLRGVIKFAVAQIRYTSKLKKEKS